jgi:hypothetical protein
MEGENRTEEPRSELFAAVWAYLPDAAAKVREEGEPSSERVAQYIEGVLAPFIHREMRAAMVQEGLEPGEARPGA